LALLGLGGAGVLVKFEPLRPTMTVLAVVLLGAGFWVTYRPVASAPTVQRIACDCEKPGVHQMGRVALWGTTALVSFILAFPYMTPYLFSE
jgi:hypothetical protein